MPYRFVPFVTGETYHVFNRSIASQPIFNNQFDYDRFLQLVKFYRFGKLPLRFSYYKRLSKELKEQFETAHFSNKKPVIKLIAYCIMPNHFHFLITPLTDNALSDFMRNIQNGYSKYFNIKYERTGSLFQFMFKGVRIETEEQLLHVSRYIHLNPVTAYLIQKEQLAQYSWSSFSEYFTHNLSNSLVDTSQILHSFKSVDAYKEFVCDQVAYQRELSRIKHMIFD